MYLFLIIHYLIKAYQYEPQYQKTYLRTPVPTNLGPVIQSIVSLTSLLVVKRLTVLVSTISNSQVFLMKKCE